MNNPSPLSPAPAEGEPYIWAKVLSKSPLITFSTTNQRCPAGLATVAADLLGGRPGLHLLHHTWTLERGHASMIDAGVEQARRELPGAQFLMLAANESEVLALHDTSVPAVIGSGLTMTDERVWYPRAVPAGQQRYDAVYVSRLDLLKRHELAAAIDSLLLIYGHSLDAGRETALDRVRRALPRATFANHQFTSGAYRPLTSDEVAALLAQSAVGLCLSAVEGCMRASMEYMLCGLPVVSTQSVGGRDRYFGAGYCKIVPQDDPDAIAWAVRDLASRNLDRSRIRDHIGQVLAFDRYNLLRSVNSVARQYFDLDYDIFPTFEPFLGLIGAFRPASEVRRRIEAELA